MFNTINLEKKKLLILGGNGFIGTFLYSSCKTELMNFEVKFAMRTLSSSEQLFVYDPDTKARQLLNDWSPDIVLNLAAAWASKGGSRNDELIANLIYPSVVCTNLPSNKTIFWIQVSSYFQLVRNQKVILNNGYVVYKNAFNQVLRNLSLEGRFKVGEITLPHVFGNGEPFSRLIPSLKKSLKNNQTVELSSGKQQIPLVNVMDASKIILEVIKSGQNESWKKINLAPVWYGTIFELAHLLKNLYASSSELSFYAIPDRTFEIYEKLNFHDCDMLIQPTITLEESILREIFDAEE